MTHTTTISVILALAGLCFHCAGFPLIAWIYVITSLALFVPEFFR